MADPTDITQLDLQNLSPEEAAKLARARLAALYDQQTHAMLGMGGAMPELQKLGAAEYGQAGKEREGVQQVAGRVLTTSLAKERNDMERQRIDIERQRAVAEIQNMKAHLGLLRAQLGQTAWFQKAEDKARRYQLYLQSHKTVPPGLIERMGQAGGDIAAIHNVSEAAGNLPLVPKKWAEAIGNVFAAGPEARETKTKEELKGGGYSQPMSFEEWDATMGGGGGEAPPMPGGGFAVPKAPGGEQAPASIGPQRVNLPGLGLHERGPDGRWRPVRP